MSERITDDVDWHNSEIAKSIANSFSQYALIMDGSPLFAEAECIIHRSVEKDSWKIKELVVDVGLFKKSLNAKTLSQNIQSAVVSKYGLRLKDLRATSLDRASTNKLALSLLLDDSRDHIFVAYCLSHGLSGSAKKHSMSVGNYVLQGLTGMVKHKLCAAREVFRDVFNESARKGGGIRWGITLEQAEQVNCIGLPRMIDEYVRHCIARNYSPASAQSVLNAVSTTQDLCKAIVEISALVEAGTPLISNCYRCETNEPIIFVVSNTLRKLMNLYGEGVDNYHFIDLVKQAHIAVDLVTKHEMVLNMCVCV
jgi:hypothetical protein